MAKKQLEPENDPDDPEYYRVRRRIDQDEMDRCCAEQAEIYGNITDRITDAVSARDQLVSDLGKKKVEAENKIRKKAGKNDEKITDKAVAAQIEADEEVVELSDQLLEAKSAVQQWQGLRADYDMRKDMLKLLTQQFGDNYWSRESITASTRRYEGAEAEHVRKETGKQRRSERKPNRHDSDED